MTAYPSSSTPAVIGDMVGSPFWRRVQTTTLWFSRRNWRASSMSRTVRSMPQIVDPDIERYAAEHSSPEPPELQAVAAETQEKFGVRAGMLTGHLEGAFLGSLVAISGARRVLEIGTFTGYSAMAMASALPPDGELVTLDVSLEHLEVARRHIEAGPWADRISVVVGPALDSLSTLDGPF